MRADICDGEDRVGKLALVKALRSEGAKVDDYGWGMGVHVVTCIVHGCQLRVYIDPWSVDIEGPEEVVTRLVETYQNTRADM
jgi:hypothetical protein